MSENGIFHALVGHDGAKAILRGALRSGDVDILLVGPSASGKSVALLAIEAHVEGALYRDASGYTEAKVRETLSRDPPLLLLDELDDMKTGAYPALYTAMEHGRIQKATMHDAYDRDISTQFFGACNDPADLPPEIRSRFQLVEFDAYDRDEFVAVGGSVLADSVEWVETADVGETVSARVYDGIDGAFDHRTAIAVARLAGSLDRVEDIIVAFNDPRAEVASDPLTPSEVSMRFRQRRDGDDEVAESEAAWLAQSCEHYTDPDAQRAAYASGRYACPRCVAERGLDPSEPVR